MPNATSSPPKRRGRPIGSKNGDGTTKPATTTRGMSRELKVMAMTSLGFVGGVKYLERVAKTNPAAYLSFLAKTLVMKDDADEGGQRKYAVQVLQVVPVPTPGVINSPVAGHIAREHVRLVGNGGEIIENEAGAERVGR